MCERAPRGVAGLTTAIAARRGDPGTREKHVEVRAIHTSQRGGFSDAAAGMLQKFTEVPRAGFAHGFPVIEHQFAVVTFTLTLTVVVITPPGAFGIDWTSAVALAALEEPVTATGYGVAFPIADSAEFALTLVTA